MKLLLSCILLGLSLSSVAQNYSGPEKEINAILKNIQTFSKHVVAGDYEAIAASYTSDGKIFPNNMDILEGTENLEKYWKPGSGSSVIHHKVTPTEIRILDNEAYDYGYYQGVSKNSSGEESKWRGKYVIIWKKIDGQWKIYLDIWNAIQS